MRALVIFLCVISLGAHAKQYGYNDGVPFHLGSGFDPFNVGEAYSSCLAHDGELRLDGQGARQSSVVLRSIKTREDLFKELGVSVEVAAQTFFASGKASASYLDQIDFFEDGLTWVILGKVDYGRVAMKEPRLLSRYQKMLDENRYADFAAACGTHYFAQEQRGGSIFAIYTLHNLSLKQKTELETMLSMNVDAGSLFSGSLDAEFRQVLQRATRSSQVEFRAFALGGGGLTELSNLATDSADILKVQEAIRKYIRTMTLQNAVPVSYQASSMKQFGYKEATPFDTALRDRALSQYYLYINEASHITNRLFKLLGRLNDDKGSLNTEQIAHYRNLYDSITTSLATAHTDADHCYEDSKRCMSPNHLLPYITWPSDPDKRLQTLTSRITDRVRPATLKQDINAPSIEQCEAIRVTQLSRGCINEREYFDLKTIEAMPFCLPGKGLVTWYFCGNNN